MQHVVLVQILNGESDLHRPVKHLLLAEKCTLLSFEPGELVPRKTKKKGRKRKQRERDKEKKEKERKEKEHQDWSIDLCWRSPPSQ